MPYGTGSEASRTASVAEDGTVSSGLLDDMVVFNVRDWLDDVEA